MKNLLKITSLANAHIKELALLNSAKERKLKGRVLVEGAHLVNEARKLGILEEVLICSEADYINGVSNILVTSDIIKKLSTTTTPQNILGVAKVKEKDIVLSDTILILDGVSDPGNFGTIVRTAKAFDVASIIVSNGSIDIYNEKVIRATQGAIFKMPIVKMEILDAIKLLKDKGYKIYSTALKDAIDIEEVRDVDKYALIVGNEANGVSDEAIKLSDQVLKIQMQGDMESLNVAIASAICIYTLNNKRK